MRTTASRNLLRTVGVLSVGALFLTACGGEGEADGADGEGSAEITTLRAGNVYASGLPVNRCGFEVLAEDPGLEEVGLALDSVDSSQLGAEGELVQQTASGELDITLGIGSMIATYAGVPSAALFEAYYLHEDLDDLERVQSTDAAQEVWAEVEEEGNLVNMGLPWLYGERHVFGNAELRGPEDFSGVDMRVPNTDISRSSAAALGANVTTVEFSELYLALQQGVVDVAEAPLTAIQTESFDEVSEYVNLTNHLITTQGVMMNADRWASLTDEQRDFLSEKVTELAGDVIDCTVSEEEEALNEWEEAGSPIVVDDVDREALAELAYEEFSEGYEWSEQYVALMEELGR